MEESGWNLSSINSVVLYRPEGSLTVPVNDLTGTRSFKI